MQGHKQVEIKNVAYECVKRLLYFVKNAAILYGFFFIRTNAEFPHSFIFVIFPCCFVLRCHSQHFLIRLGHASLKYALTVLRILITCICIVQ